MSRSASWTTAPIDIANAPAMINRVTYTGDLGYEIWVGAGVPAPALQRDHGRGCRTWGSRNFGMRALLSLRLEKNFPTWYRELRPIYGAFEAGLERFVDLSKADFIGKRGACREQRRRRQATPRHLRGRC